MLFKRLVNKVKQEPIIFLYRKMWKMAEGNRGMIALYLFMFLLANLVLLLQPWIYGQFLNEIQQKGLNGENLKYLLFLLFSFSITETLFWALWGPARLIEEYTAFKTNVN